MMIQQRNIELDKKSSIQQCYNNTSQFNSSVMSSVMSKQLLHVSIML